MKVSGWKLLAIVSGLAGVAILLVFLFRPSESVEQAARNYLTAFLDRDTHRLLGYMRSEEKELSQLNADRLRQFYDVYLNPRLSGFSPSGEPEIMKFEAAGAVSITQDLRHEDGRTTVVKALLMETEEGPKVVGGLYYAMFSAYLPRLRPGQPFPTGSDKYRFYQTVLLEDLEELDRTGINMVGWITDAEYTLTKLTWRQAADQFGTLAQKIETRSRGDDTR